MNVMKVKQGNISLSAIIAVTVGLLVLIGVAVPVTRSSITSANFTTGSINATIGSNLSILLMVGAIILIVSLYNVSTE